MSGPIVRTGTTPKFWENWDRVFGGKTKKQSAGRKQASAKKKTSTAKATAKSAKAAKSTRKAKKR